MKHAAHSVKHVPSIHTCVTSTDLECRQTNHMWFTRNLQVNVLLPRRNIIDVAIMIMILAAVLFLDGAINILLDLNLDAKPTTDG